jgi:hypothetical protein
LQELRGIRQQISRGKCWRIPAPPRSHSVRGLRPRRSCGSQGSTRTGRSRCARGSCGSGRACGSCGSCGSGRTGRTREGQFDRIRFKLDCAGGQSRSPIATVCAPASGGI